jgi:formylglycine-generating enzyme
VIGQTRCILLLVSTLGLLGCPLPSSRGMAIVKGGRFLMGRSGPAPIELAYTGEDELPVHSVKVHDFYISIYEVTQAEWRRVMGEHDNPSFYKGNRRPVESVSWYRAVEYCNLRSTQEGYSPCYTIDKTSKDERELLQDDFYKWTVICDFSKDGYRLPTEAEWEYAASGGRLSKTKIFSGGDVADEVGWYLDNTRKPQEAQGRTQPVGRKQPNELGIFDMSGNVFEWCWDRYGQYQPNDQEDPTGPETGYGRVLRGGAYCYNIAFLGIHFRLNLEANTTSPPYGFRVVRTKM